MDISHKNHYEEIGTIIMCYPYSFKLKKLSFKWLNYKKMLKQYDDFVNLLINEGAKIQFLDPIYGSNQIFTRDVGFVIDNILFISKLANKKREKETLALKSYVKDNKITMYEMNNYIEGGDVIIYNEYVFIGMSSRTTLEAAKELQNYLNLSKKNYKVITIRFNKEKMLHLDCVFNILDDNHAIISDYVYDRKLIEDKIQNIYYIDNKTTRELGINIVTLGKKRIITSNKKVKKELEERGFNAFYLDYSEISKAGGSFGCSTLPVFRK
ncbi:amidinotransferase [Clostridium botulinum]|uniref:dimethylarginine dimethylaminohydrolase family protein n=1 Tax=Clostridium TaxID=1485 RepID=UPI0005008EC6|nr:MULTISPECIES: arginine deiminase family protein [unclassified Clostridium]AIY80276.1 amidinotransferase family protein [Clostridium botulinum 202F]KAI3348805.1 arginine deiminase family protein [Clostridium botulinum]KFX54534.1 amidinotransferase [Clostridium botulinum]KFX60281.1 amidinotransferase [Clostridium botulinum]KON12392.1 amidinotransferase [Clostridium botulinum]